MKIMPFRVSRLYMEELHGFLREVLSHAHNLLPGKEEQPMVAQLEAVVEEYSAALRQDIANPFSETVEQADRETEEAIRAIRNYVKALCDDPDIASATIARRILDECFYRYSDPSSIGASVRYGMYTHILGQLEGLPAEEKSALGLERWIERMAHCFAQYTELYEAHTTEAITYITGLNRTMRDKAEQAYRKMVIAINALVTLYGDDVYGEFVDTLNTIIAKKRAVIAARRTRKENKEMDNNENEMRVTQK